jgi:hypothetical protein
VKFAVSMCGKCKTNYDSYIEVGAYIKCPTCSQMNAVTMASKTVTGRCENCQRPIDDHRGGHCP